MKEQQSKSALPEPDGPTPPARAHRDHARDGASSALEAPQREEESSSGVRWRARPPGGGTRTATGDGAAGPQEQEVSARLTSGARGIGHGRQIGPAAAHSAARQTQAVRVQRARACAQAGHLMCACARETDFTESLRALKERRVELASRAREDE